MDFGSHKVVPNQLVKLIECLNRNSKSCIKPAVVPLTSRMGPLISFRAPQRLKHKLNFERHKLKINAVIIDSLMPRMDPLMS